jgi:hypothetical protein
VLIGNGDGTFQPAVSFNSAGFGVNSLAVGDVNGDGKLDVVVAYQCSDPTCPGNGLVAVLLGNGNGTFQTALSTLTPFQLSGAQIALADFDGDGKLDVAIGGGSVLLFGQR